MATDAKSALLLALTPKGASSSKGGDEGEKSEDASAAQDILDAIESKDAGALKAALRGFVSECMADYDKEDSETEGA